MQVLDVYIFVTPTNMNMVLADEDNKSTMEATLQGTLDNLICFYKVICLIEQQSHNNMKKTNVQNI